jgi:glycerol-1-phosphate dehydrogenase [NAD(P)+]
MAAQAEAADPVIQRKFTALTRATEITIPTLVRIKPGALDRLGIYLRRHGIERVARVSSAGLVPAILERLEGSLAHESVAVIDRFEVSEPSFDQASANFAALPGDVQALVGVGGGRALDSAKCTASLGRLPLFAVPTSLSNDGFCSPQSRLTLAGQTRSVPTAMPFGVVIDTEVCRSAPDALFLSGVGDLVAKVTAIEDWRIAFHERGTPINDFAALLSDATVFQFMARPSRDPEGMRLLGTALMLNGIAMGIAGSSRPASGSEHLISHALDRIAKRPLLHGLQVGVATCLVSHLQGKGTERIGQVLNAVGFWDEIRRQPLDRAEWLEAVRLAPTLKDDFHTVLSSRDCLPEVEALLREDPALSPCFF